LDEVELAAAPWDIATAALPWDLVVFDGLRQFASAQRREALSLLWHGLSEHGLLIVIEAVSSGDPGSHPNAMRRDELIQLLTFAEPPTLYRADCSWLVAEDPAAVAAKDYLADSLLVSRKTRLVAVRSGTAGLPQEAGSGAAHAPVQ
jgi:hypothetical protein